MKLKLSPHWILLIPGMAMMLFFFIVPLGQIFIISFFKSQPDGAFTLENYSKFLTDSHYLKILWRTIWIGFVTSIVCLVLGYFLSYGIARAKAKYQNFLLLLVILPLLTSAVVRNFGWMVIMGKKGLINETLLALHIISSPIEILYTPLGVIIAMTHVLLPFMVLVLYPILSSMDLNIEHASENLGASPFKTFWLVTIPLSLPGIFAGTLLVFSIAISFYITPALIGGPKVPVMATEIYNQTMNLLNWSYASSIAVILLIAVLLIISIYNKMLSKVSNQGGGL
ncbi:ABC transporter permease [Sporosarcina obsidiansis]|uniref:ABC transporter permease n=1 Tax=Sporosarcina obsidiansis TaxID=2660748 RepID=UPI00129A1F63|nr:ABC transporter permease [Sporosarcina obsidiansis]